MRLIKINHINMEKLKTMISSYVEEFNEEWYNKKQKEFKKFNDGSSVNITGRLIIEDISIIRHEDENGDQTKEDEIESSSHIMDFDFVSYCNYYLPLDQITEWGRCPVLEYYLEPNKYKSYNIPEMVEDLLHEVDKYIAPSKSSYEYSIVISKIIGLVNDSITVQKIVFNKTMGNEILDSYLNEFVSSINSRYSLQLTHNDLINNLKDKLEFKLTQDQLLSLLYILYTADFFNSQDYLPAVKFFFYNFTYRDDSGVQVAPSTLTNFQKKFSTIRSSQSSKSKVLPNGLDFVKTKLSHVIRRLS
jgi:hypothetical protein